MQAKSISWTLGIAVVLLLSLGVASSAWAATALEEVLGDVQWGDSKSTVLEKLKEEKVETIRQQAKYRNNRVAMQEARKSALDEIDRVRKSYEELEGKETGYDVSVIAGEFTRNNDEAVMRAQDDKAQKFYFFHDGAFYKLLIAYKQEYVHSIPFDRFVKSVAQKYGKPDSLNRSEGDLAGAEWQGRKTTLRVENEMDFFGNYVMVFADRQKVERMKKKGEKLGGREKDDDQVSERVQKLKEGSDEDPNENVVDDMVGESVEVDFGREKSLEEERPDSEQEEFADKEAEETDQESKSDESGDEAGSDDAEEKQAASSQSASGGQEEASGSSDEGGGEGGGDGGDDEDLVIY